MFLNKELKNSLRRKSFFILLLFAASLIHPFSCARAENLKFKKPLSIRLEKIGGGRIFDNEQKREEEIIPFDSKADVDTDKNGELVRIWSYAETKNGLADSRIRGIDYEDFVIRGNAPENSKVKCELIVVYECAGLANAARFGSGKAFYYAKLNSGLLLEQDNKAWDSPALGKTIFFQTNDSGAPVDWSKDLMDMINKQIASQLVEEAAKAGAKALGAASTSVTIVGAVVTIAMEVIDFAINFHEKEEDRKNFEFTTRGSGSIAYKDIWLKVAGDFGRKDGGTFGNVYRTFLGLDIKSLALAVKENDTTSMYVDFYNHEPHDSDANGAWLARRGFRIKDIYLNCDSESIILPKNYSYPVIDVEEVKRYSFKDEPIRLGEEQIMSVKFVNRGGAGFRPCRVRVSTPDPDKSFDIELVKDIYGSEYEYRFPYTFNKTGSHAFIFEIDPEGRLDDYMDLSLRKVFYIDVQPLPDLKVEIMNMPAEVIINKEVSIPLKVTNIGESASAATDAQLLVNSRVVEGKSVRPLAQGVSEILFFKWTPTGRKDYDLAFNVDAMNRIKEYKEDNNETHEKVSVLAPEYDWFIKEGSLMLDSSEPETGEEVRVYFTIKNNGRSQEKILYDVLIDDKRIISHAVDVKPDTTYTVGVAPQEKITWKVSGGRHVIKVVLDPQGQFYNPAQIGVIQELVITADAPVPAVAGADFVLDPKDISVEDDRIVFKIYNRGANPALAAVDFKVYEFHKDSPRLIRARGPRAFAGQSYETFWIEKPPYNSKIEVLIDPDNMVKEFDENNNIFTYNYGFYEPPEPKLFKRAQKPDLAAAQIVNLDRPMEVGEEREITIGVGNLNLVDAKDVEIEYKFINKSVRDKDAVHGYCAGAKNLGTVPAEEKKTLVVNYKAVYPGQYSMEVVVDPKNKVKETDDVHNNKLEKSFSVGGDVTAEMYFSGKNVDLAVDNNIKVSNTEPAAGVAVDFEAVAYNNSDIEVWGADLDMFVDSELASGYPLGTLSPNSSKTFNFSHTFTATGDYTVKFTADAKEAVPERDESNNSASVAIKVQPGIYGTGHRDLAVTEFSLSKSSCIQGEFVRATAVIKNTGQDELAAVLCTIGPSGTKPFYAKVFPVIDPGEEVEISAALPALTAGEHIVEARVDGMDVYKEENEDNNVMSASLKVEPITKEGIKAKAVGAVIEGVDKVREGVGKWLRGLGKPKE